jgi:hypothetical protein
MVLIIPLPYGRRAEGWVIFTGMNKQFQLVFQVIRLFHDARSGNIAGRVKGEKYRILDNYRVPGIIS